MAEKVTIELPEELVQQVRTVASRTHRSFDEVLADCIRLAGIEPAVELLNDEELLAVADSEWDASLQDSLSDLLERNQEGTLDAGERRRLDDLMRTYRAGLVRKAQAIKVAVNRGLRPRLG
jgi:predicted transcriptional regulator